MPQVDPSSFASQIFWLIVLFATLYVIVIKLILPRMTATLELRQRTISDNLARAVQAREEAEAVLSTYEQALAGARGQAHASLRAAQDAIGEESARREQTQATAIAAQIAAAEQRIATAAAEAKTTIGDAVAEVTADLVAGISGKQPTANQVETAVALARKAADARPGE